MGERWVFNRQKKNSCCSVRGLSIVVGSDVSLFVLRDNQPFQNRYSSCLVGPDIELTTSDPRQDGQSSPFTTSSSQKVHGMRNCRALIVAEIEKPPLMEHQRLYPLLFAS